MLANRVHNLAHFLEANFAKGVISSVPNSVECAELFLACAISGIKYFPLENNCSKLKIEEMSSRVSIENIVISQNSKLWQQIDSESSSLKWISLNEVQGDDCSCNFKSQPGLLLMESSGTTGEPKIMYISSNRLWNSAKTFGTFYGIHSQHRFWNYLSMSYLGGLFNLLLIPIAANSSIYIDEKFNAKSLIAFEKILMREEINVIWFVPTIIRGLLRSYNNRSVSPAFRNIEISFVGTAPIRSEEKKAFEEKFGIPVYENYGLSETTFLSCQKKDDFSNLDHFDSQGIPYPGVKIQIDINNLEGETEGEILVQSPFLFEGYLESSSTEGSTVENSWFHTGDVGKMVENRLVLTGRIREIIKKGGVLINLNQIENKLKTALPGLNVIAVPIEDDYYGENYVLIVETFESDLDTDEFHLIASNTLGRGCSPKVTYKCFEFKYTQSGKIMKTATLAALNKTK